MKVSAQELARSNSLPSAAFSHSFAEDTVARDASSRLPFFPLVEQERTFERSMHGSSIAARLAVYLESGSSVVKQLVSTSELMHVK